MTSALERLPQRARAEFEVVRKPADGSTVASQTQVAALIHSWEEEGLMFLAASTLFL